jgi:hypothetical protein
MFFFTTASRPALRPTEPPIQWVSGSLSLGVKWPGCEADYSPPSSAEVKNVWGCTSAPQYTFMVWFSLKKMHLEFTTGKERMGSETFHLLSLASCDMCNRTCSSAHQSIYEALWLIIWFLSLLEWLLRIPTLAYANKLRCRLGFKAVDVPLGWSNWKMMSLDKQHSLFIH